MAEKCYSCQKDNPGGVGNIPFNFQGFRFIIFKSGYECEQCVQKEFIELFEEHGKGLVSLAEGKIVVNWSLFCKTYHSARSGTYSATRKNAMINILLSLSVFSYRSKGNWDIVSSHHIGLNPRSVGLSYLYFIHKEDVIEFARLEFPNTLYDWEVCHYDNVLTKKDILDA